MAKDSGPIAAAHSDRHHDERNGNLRWTPLQRDQMRASLLAWYGEHKRSMPWRGVADPYATWVSEIMLQQTRVEAVRPYFERWMERFPTVSALAAAPLDDVLHAWQGLGYYTRARNLHRGAAWVVAHHRGELPRDVEQLRAIPGVGPYTAGAIASIAFGLRAPLVDGNVERVLARVFALDDEPRSAAGQRLRWRLAAELVDPEAPGDWNQALMELGSTVCTPRGARCDRCPLAPQCIALADARVGELPRPPIRRSSPTDAWWAFAVQDSEGRLLVARRPATGLLASLWDIPLVPAAADPASDWNAATGSRLFAFEELAPIEHVFSHRRWLATPVRARELSQLPSMLPSYPEIRWISRHERSALAWSRLAQRILAQLDGIHD